MKNYEVRFSIWGVVLFLAIMLPNLIWFAIPAPNDVLRMESQTEVVDTAASVCQMLFIAALCVTANKDSVPLRATALIIGVIVCTALYYFGWVLYYFGLTNPPVILLLTVPPCVAFLFFAYDRKNYLALIPAVIFSVCHLFYGAVNFIAN